MAVALDAKRVVAAILAGHLDNNKPDVDQAWRQRAVDLGGALAWKITWHPEDLTVTEEELTPADLRIVHSVCGVGWRDLPDAIDTNMGVIVTVLALGLQRRDGLDKLSDAVARIEAHPVLGNLELGTYVVGHPLGRGRTSS